MIAFPPDRRFRHTETRESARPHSPTTPLQQLAFYLLAAVEAANTEAPDQVRVQAMRQFCENALAALGQWITHGDP